MGVIPIVNENDTIAVTEIKFGDNDTLSAITAAMVHADYLFLMTDVDCLYDKNPRTHPNAKAIEVVEDISTLEADGNFPLKYPFAVLTKRSIQRRLSPRHRRHVHQNRRRAPRNLSGRNNNNNPLLQPRQYSKHSSVHPSPQNDPYHHATTLFPALRQGLLPQNINRRTPYSLNSIPEPRARHNCSITYKIHPLPSAHPRQALLAPPRPHPSRHSLHRRRCTPGPRKQSRTPPRWRSRR